MNRKLNRKFKNHNLSDESLDLLSAYRQWEDACYVQQIEKIKNDYKNFVWTLKYLRFRRWLKNLSLSSAIPLLFDNQSTLELLYKYHDPS